MAQFWNDNYGLVITVVVVVYIVFRVFRKKTSAGTASSQTITVSANATTPSGSSPQPLLPKRDFVTLFKHQQWLSRNWQLIAGFALVHSTLWVFFHRESLYRGVVGSPAFLVGQLLVILVFLTLRKPDDKGRVRLHLLGKIAILIIIAGCVLKWFRNGDSVDLDMANHTVESSPAFRNAEPAPQKNASVEKLVRKFWTQNLEAAEATKMIAWAERSSNFNQFEADGKRPFRGRDNRYNIGVMGINEKSWRDEIPKCEKEFGKGQCNISEGPGNLNMALYIFRNHHGDRWWQERNLAETGRNPVSAGAKKVPANELVYLAQPGQTLTVSAPVDGVGEKVVLPTGVCAKEEPKGRVKAAINGGSPTYERWPGNVPKIPGKTYSVRYQSAEETPGEVSLGFYICAARP